MAVSHSLVAVGNTATSLLTSVPNIDAGSARSVLFTNAGAESVFLGGPTVTATDYGYELVPGGEVAFDLTSGRDVLFAVAAESGSVRALHVGV